MRALVVAALLALAGCGARQDQEQASSAAPVDLGTPPSDAERTASGLASKVLSTGTGTDRPGASDSVTVQFTGRTADGRTFDGSMGDPATWDLGDVVPGLAEGLQLMAVGERRRLWIPESATDRGRSDLPDGTLVFDIGFLGVEHATVTPAVPEDVAQPPSDAETTASGLRSRVLTPGTGRSHPTAASRVRVHYTGWTTDGEMFDSSVTRGAPATFGLNQVIPGWTEGVQLMVVGEKRRFWIPESLAYEGRPGPQGTLVFDVELLAIVAAE